MKTKMQRIAVVDLETTGSHVDEGDQIIQIGAVLIEAGQIVAQHSMLLNPERDIPSQITAITGIHPDHVAEAPTFHQVAGLWHERLKDCFFVAHNLGFDLTFLQAKFKEEGYDFAPAALDTVQLAKIFLPDAAGFNLQDLSQRFGLDFQDAHDALGDARMTAYLLDALSQVAQQLDYGTKVALQPIFKALPYEASRFLNQPAAFACQVDWPSTDQATDAMFQVRPRADQLTAAAYWLEAGQGHEALVLEARARQDHPGYVLALLAALESTTGPRLLVLENDALVSQWQTVLTSQTAPSYTVERYWPSQAFLDAADVYQFCQQFDLERANQQELTVLAGALVWLTQTPYGCLEELNPELDLRAMMRRYDYQPTVHRKQGYRRYLDQLKSADVLLFNQTDWLSLQQVEKGPLAFIQGGHVVVADLSALYQGLVQATQVRLDLSDLFVDLKGRLDQAPDQPHLAATVEATYQVLEAVRSGIQDHEEGGSHSDWRAYALSAQEATTPALLAQVTGLAQSLNDWLKQASLKQSQRRYYRRQLQAARQLARSSKGTYLMAQGQVSNGQLYQLSLNRVRLQLKASHLPQLAAYDQVLFLSDGQYDYPLGQGLFALWNLGARYLPLPEGGSGTPLTVAVPMDYAQVGAPHDEAEQVVAFVQDYLAAQAVHHVLILANNKAQAQTYYRLLRESPLLEAGYLIYSQGQNGSLKKIKRRAETDERAIVVVPRRLFLEEAFSLAVADLLVVVDRLPFDSLTSERTQGLKEVLSLADHQTFEAITLPQMIFRLKQMLAQVAAVVPQARYQLLDERVWTRYYSQTIQHQLAPGITIQPLLPEDMAPRKGAGR